VLRRVSLSLLLVLTACGVSEGPETKDRASALAFCEQSVRDVLTSPASAVFASREQVTITGSTGIWRIYTHVDAQNAFGVPLRSYIMCSTLRGSAGEWLMLDAKTQRQPFDPEREELMRNVRREWTEVARWQGSGDKTTQRFRIEGDRWRISYSGRFGQLGPVGMLGITVYDEGGRYISNATLEREGNDVTHVQQGPGIYYLEVDVVNMAWGAVVEDFRPVSESGAAESLNQ
jgi:hypothetical protein